MYCLDFCRSCVTFQLLFTGNVPWGVLFTGSVPRGVFVNKGLTSFCSSSILFTTESELAVFCLLPWAWLAGQSVFKKSFLQDVRHNLQE